MRAQWQLYFTGWEYPTFLLCLLLFFSVPLLSQTPNFKHYTGDDVLPSSNVYAAFQDSKGYMWFGTDLGVTRFDGYSFTTYSTKDGLSDREVFNFYEDRAGRIWFMTMNGKVSYYHDGEIINSEIDSTLLPLDSRSHISSMREDHAGNLWISTYSDGLIVRRRDLTVDRFFVKNSFLSIHNFFFKRKNEIFLFTHRGTYTVAFNEALDSVMYFNFVDVGKKIEIGRHYEMNENFPKAILIDEQTLLYKDGRWLFICDLKRGTHERRAFTGNGGNILNMHRDGSNYWMGTANGAVLYDLQNDKKLSAVLKDYQITGVVKDIEDNYWFTSYGGGIFFCTSLEMFSYTSQDGLISDQVTCLNKKQNGEIWLGFGMDGSKPGAYVSYIHHNKIHPVRLTNQPSFDRLITKQITFYENRKWITTTHGVFCLEENRHIVAFSYGRCLLEYPENMIWYGSGGSVFKNNRADYVRLGKNALSPEANQTGMFTIGLVSLNKYMMKPKALYADLYGRVWAGAKEGLFQLQDTALIKVSPENSGVHAPVNDFVEMPDSTLVMATDGDGIVINKNNRWVMTINEDNGLSTNICKAVAIDPDGVLWVATHRGLNKISGYPDNVTVEYLTIFDGILSNDVSDVLIHDDTVWVATNKGLNFFHRKHVQRKTNSPRVYIDRITVKGVPVKINNDGDEISLKYSENDIGIKYTGLLFSNGEPLLYRYKLHREDPWRFTKNTTVYLPELIAGDYEFIVSAKGLAGQWSQEASLTFSIKKPFWKTGLFIAAVIFITLGIIGWIANIYIDQQRKEMQRQHRVTLSELRSLRAQMNPHFLFNALNSIQGVLLKNNIETTQDYLGRFGKLMRLILDHSDKTTITIREELESITNYLEIEQLRAGHQFEYRIDIDPELSIESAEIPAMILQPFIENAIWHGFGHKRDGSDLLVIRFGMRNNDIIITITDNGIGRKRALALRKPNHKSKGLQLVKERIDILNYNNSRKIELKIEDLEDEHGNHPGTHVIIKIPSIY